MEIVVRSDSRLCRCVSAEARAKLPSPRGDRLGPSAEHPGFGQPQRSGRSRVQLEIWRISPHTWSHVCRGATIQGEHLGIPTSVSYFTHAGRLSALRSMIARYSSRMASAIASRIPRDVRSQPGLERLSSTETTTPMEIDDALTLPKPALWAHSSVARGSSPASIAASQASRPLARSIPPSCWRSSPRSPRGHA